jgi:hypothetical protein
VSRTGPTRDDGPPTALSAGALRALPAPLRGALLLPGESGYDSARRVWNAAVDERPAGIVRCACTADVVAAVRFAREVGASVSVRGGGHSFAGFGVRDGALTIDLGAMKAVRIDPARRVALAEPGLTWGEFGAAAQVHGLATTGGDVASVGIAGLTLGGGTGWLHRLHGAACDNLLAAEAVTADGRVLRASADEHPDLFWALRGGGGNFGVVTRLEYRLHAVGEILGGILVHPIAHARDVLHLYRETCARAPDRLRLAVFMVTAPPARWIPEAMRGRPVVLLCAAYVGPTAEGERVVRPIRERVRPIVDLIRPRALLDLQHYAPPDGLHHFSIGEALSDLDDVAIDALAEGAAAPVSPFMIILLHQLGGAIARVPPGATAFSAHRYAAHTVGIHCMWRAHDPPDPHVRWTRALWGAVRHCSHGGAPVNMLGDEGGDRVKAAYGPSVWARLSAVKAQYDRENFFHVNHNVPPARSNRGEAPGRSVTHR